MPSVVDDASLGPGLSFAVPPVDRLPLEELRHEASPGLAGIRKSRWLSNCLRGRSIKDRLSSHCATWVQTQHSIFIFPLGLKVVGWIIEPVMIDVMIKHFDEEP